MACDLFTSGVLLSRVGLCVMHLGQRGDFLPKRGLQFSSIAITKPKRATSTHPNSGEVAEWSNAAVLKTVEVRASQGSNPCLSAISLNYDAFIGPLAQNPFRTVCNPDKLVGF